jgi:hypothetical protein
MRLGVHADNRCLIRVFYLPENYCISFYQHDENEFFTKIIDFFYPGTCKIKKTAVYLHPQLRGQLKGKKHGPFVYRLGRKIFILERGVRLPYGLLTKKIIKKKKDGKS